MEMKFPSVSVGVFGYVFVERSVWICVGVWVCSGSIKVSDCFVSQFVTNPRDRRTIYRTERYLSKIFNGRNIRTEVKSKQSTHAKLNCCSMLLVVVVFFLVETNNGITEKMKWRKTDVNYKFLLYSIFSFTILIIDFLYNFSYVHKNIFGKMKLYID